MYICIVAVTVYTLGAYLFLVDIMELKHDWPWVSEDEENTTCTLSAPQYFCWLAAYENIILK